MNSTYERAVALFNTQRYADAELELRRVIGDMPGHLRANALLSQTLGRLGRHQEAIEQGRVAVGCDPQQAVGYYVLGLALVAVYRDLEGLEVLDRALAISPAMAATWSVRALAELHLKRFDEALAHAQHALGLDPRNRTAARVQGMALRGLGRNDESAAAISDALGQEPNDALSHESLARTHLANHEYEASRDAFREALRLNPQSNSARTGLRATLLANHLAYRLLLRYNMWFARRSDRAKKAVSFTSLVSLFLVTQITALAPATHALIVVAAVLLTGLVWMSPTWSALVLMADRFGREVTTQRERCEAIGLAAVLVCATVFAFWGALTQHLSALQLLPFVIAGSVVIVKRLRIRESKRVLATR